MEGTIATNEVRIWKRYEKYGEAPTNYLSHMPEHWGYAPIWTLFEIGRGRVISHEEIFANQGVYPVYSSQTFDDGILGYIDTYDFEGEYLTWTTDGANAGTVFHRNGQFSCTNVCGTLQPIKPDEHFAPYYKYALNTVTANFVRHDINPKLMNNVMARIRVYLPPLEEQQAIAAFLDRETARIDALIGHKERLIALLEEKRQAVISHAVTRGLDPNAKMKDTRNEWIPEVPDHWTIARLGFYSTRVGDGLHGTPEYDDSSDIQFINGSNLRLGEIVDTSTTRRVGESEYDKYKVKLGDTTLLLSINGTIGSVAYYRGQKIVLSKSAAYVNLKKDVSRDFVFYFIQAPPVLHGFLRDSGGTTIPNLSLESIGKTWIAIPPEDEQASIADYLKEFVSSMDEAENKVVESIDRLQEYRTALISAAVTGQIDVREEATAQNG